MNNENVKKVYDVNDIKEMLGLGRSKAYEFLEEVYYTKQPFAVLKIGKLYKVPKESFDLWISGNEFLNNE